ncbi:UDP-2,4-diacetamido-2,4,6-trideoxy-beta-L-altropyranose hydrolase [Paenibacillus alkaliterrae]|uniref:UDP-2,4-diacetamido-2,4, 6-trideoxy-beta-L-altropyranose hydrolase n=1 Tax=Paenibacillus alkaliterrae TaxID=320909 RepID=UPI001F2FA2A5|nr:UDP-2,4-diacetamido-2,4,6-trideoxy-beta-L-altropyranose hydrolase [Paenibacillus alkaliterrae]MCF2941397.1 UDP-2,4-diacetamido-2,4,6-trideoxy-beta-L-altropyranose hydrolase [Paenibacillus alkaliterrae]
MNVFIRVDASITIGTGHVMRCLTLANELRRHKAEVSFICRHLKGDLINYIRSGGFTVYALPYEADSEFFEWLQHNWKQDAEETQNVLKSFNDQIDVLIADHYGIDEKWEWEMYSHTKRVMIIDDLANRKHYCNLLLDQNYYSNLSERYHDLVPSTCKLMLGPAYVLLRDEFKEASRKKRNRTGEIQNILVFFGGTDPTNETHKAIEALSFITKQDLRVNVLVGSSNPNKERIEHYCLQYDHFCFYCQVSNIAEMINQADLVIGAGGTTTWERCYLGVPSMTIVVADNQLELTKAVSKFGATILLGTSIDVEANDIKLKLEELIENPNVVKKLAEMSGKLVSHKDVDQSRVVQMILEENSNDI